MATASRHNALTVWSAAEIAKLKKWRAAGVTYEEIATRLGRSRNAVRSKANDIGLPPLRTPAELARRRSPDAPAPEPVQRAGKTTLPPLPSLQDFEP